MKKLWILFGVILSLLALGQDVQADSQIKIDDSQVAVGKVGVYYNTGTQKKIKLMITKGSEKYSYNLTNLDRMVNFPLQMGNGTYSVKVYENTEGNKYRVVTGKDITVNLKDPNSVFLQSVQEIEWNEKKKAIQVTDKLIAQKEKELKRKLKQEELIQVVYQYIIEKIVYDYKKIEGLTPLYLPDIDHTITTSSGICYDYSSLFAAVLRNSGIPTKMAKGYSTYTDVYHAWNEVLVNGKWVIVDSTTDAYLFQNKAKYEFEKKLADYTKAKEL